MEEVGRVSKVEVEELALDLGPLLSVGSAPCGRSRRFPLGSRPSETRWTGERRGKASRLGYTLPGTCSSTQGEVEVSLGAVVAWPSSEVSSEVEVDLVASQVSKDEEVVVATL